MSPVASVIVGILLYWGVAEGSQYITGSMQNQLEQVSCKQAAAADRLPPDCN
jgi:hypothetical protein